MSKDIYEVPAHEYSLAGVINNVQGHVDKKTDTYQGGLFSGMSAGLGNAMGAIGSAVGGMAGAAIGGGKTSPAGDIIGGLGKIAGAIPGPWGAIAGAGLGVISGLTNAAFGSKINQENVNAINNNITALNSFKSNASSFDDLSQNINSQPTAMRFNQSTVGSDGWFSNKAKNMYKDLVAQQDAAQQFVNNSITNNMNNLVNTQYHNLAASYAAQGGPLETHGAEWNTGLNYIGAGGSHESNPNNGVQMGIAPDGLPNLVEEGEVIWNGDYVFSKRLKVNKSDKEKLKLGHKDDSLSFADAALKLNKEMDEMPNDPIAKRSRDAMLGRLADAQEIKRAKIQAKEQQKAMMAQALLSNAPIEQPVEQPVEESPEIMQPNQPELPAEMPMGYAANGGPIGHKYAIGGSKPDLTLREGGLDERYYNWLEKLSDAEYQKILNSVYPNKGRTKANYDKYLKDRVGFFNFANTGKPAGVYNAIKTAGDKVMLENPQVFYGSTPDVILDADRLPGYNYKSNLKQFFDDLPVVVGDNTVIPSQNGAEFIPPYNTNGAMIDHPHFTVDKKGRVIPIGSEKGAKDPYYDPVSRLRYMPAVGSAISVFSDLLGLTNTPDYSAANAIAASTKGLRDVSFTPIGDYATYRPVDIMAPINQINANAGATRRNIINTSGGNRGTAMAGLLAADNAFNNNIGQTYINAENTNYDRYMKALAHNASINQFNSQGALQAATANQRMDEVRARYSSLAADARMKALQQASAARSANLTNLFDNLGNIGIDAANRMDAKWMAKEWPGATPPSAFGQGTQSGYVIGMNGEQIPIYTYRANGGKLNKKRKRRTII